MTLDFKLVTSAKLCLLFVTLPGSAWAVGSEANQLKNHTPQVFTPEPKQNVTQDKRPQPSSVENQPKPFELVMPPKLNLGLCDS